MQILDSSTIEVSLCILHKPIATEPASTELNCCVAFELLNLSNKLLVSFIISFILFKTSDDTSENNSY